MHTAVCIKYCRKMFIIFQQANMYYQWSATQSTNNASVEVHRHGFDIITMTHESFRT